RYNAGDAHLLLNAVDTRNFFAQPRGKQRVPTVGMLRENIDIKGEDVLIAALEIARREVPDLQLIAFGPERPTRRHPMPDGTIFIHRPTVDEIRGIYAQCDAWLFASRAGTEGFGMPVLEAMACRTPVIGVPTGAAPELLADGAGLLVPHDDPKATADAIVRIARMADADWRTMSETAWRRAQEHRLKDASDEFEKLLRFDVGF
ncbi:glycosyltransferase, partial [bacterium]